jgi:prevent-host-death family protein
MKKQITIAEAKDQLPGIIHEAERGKPIEITRRGKPVAVILSITEYTRIRAGKRGFWNLLQDFLKSGVGKAVWAHPDFTRNVRDRSIGRRVRI